MNKILLVSKREFLTRVQKKTFLLTTILLPLIIFGFYAMIIYFSVNSGSTTKIAVSDNAGVFGGSIDTTDEASFQFINNKSESELKQQVTAGKFDGYIYIPQTMNVMGNDSIQLVSAKTVGLLSRAKIQDVINKK